ncbi:enoyl-CoA hydratase/isomerase family protein [Microbacterium gorillae]|uniref:enoyl-CoA hydratase/isomerase family protein n=1 Tax=Microbacterium gorillae TaxID=1231063 RepID=UPI00058E84FA|nr:enoyl-CoA hydratase/isomerase family protein [Microbacterium gorillae]
MSHVALELGSVARLHIDNPPVNALSAAVLGELAVAIARVAASDARVLVLTAATGSSFLAGGDIRELLAVVGDAAAVERHLSLTDRVFADLDALPVPVNAAVDGVAAGGGLEVLLCCDIVIASPRSRFGVPEVRLGLIPGAGGTQRLPRRIPRGIAREWVLTGRLVPASEAHAAGLVNMIGDDPVLAAEAMAARIDGYAPAAVHAATRATRYVGDLDAGLALERELFADLLADPATVAGLRAFLDK